MVVCKSEMKVVNIKFFESCFEYTLISVRFYRHNCRTGGKNHDRSDQGEKFRV